jgi:hypothetical protein
MNQLSFDGLLADQNKMNTSLQSLLDNDLLELLESDLSSALEMCEHLIKEGKLSNERYSSNKPKAYPKVCAVLDDMVQQEKVLFVEEKGKGDRIYQLKF